MTYLLCLLGEPRGHFHPATDSQSLFYSTFEFLFFCFLFLYSNCHQVLNIKDHQQQSCRPYYLVNKISMVPSSVSLSLLIKRMYRILIFFFFVYRMIDKSLSLHERTWIQMGSSNCLFDLILLLSSWNTDQL